MVTMIGWLIGNLLQMDHLDETVVGDRVIYKYKTTSITKRPSIVELKAKIMSVLDMPSDIPIDVRITPAKAGIITKEYLVEIEVPRGRFTADSVERVLKRKYKLSDVAEF